MNDVELAAMAKALAAPFPVEDVRFKPQAVNGNKALAIAYANARAVMDRLDAVFGVEGWQDDYECLSDNSVVCRLRVRLGGEWIQKTDVGCPSEQPDAGDRLKAAFSDALKRAAVKLGIGRYLYKLPKQWVDYDPSRRQFTGKPDLPTWARPVATKATIDKQQGDELAALIKKHGAVWQALAEHYQIAKLGELSHLHFEDAKRRVAAGKFTPATAFGAKPSDLIPEGKTG